MLRQARHHAIGILDRHLVEPKPAQEGLDIELEQPRVVIRRGLGRHVVGGGASELAARPSLPELLERGHGTACIARPARAESIHRTDDALPRASRSCPGSHLQDVLDLVVVTAATQPTGQGGERAASVGGFAFALAARQREVSSSAAAKRDACGEAVGELAEFSSR